MSDEYKSPFFDDDEISSFSNGGDSEDLYSTSENQLDLNSFISEDQRPKAENKPKKKRIKDIRSFKDVKDVVTLKGVNNKKKFILRAALSVCLVFVITMCLVVGGFAVVVLSSGDDYQIKENLYDLKLNSTTTIYVEDKATGEYVEYQRLHGGENRIWVPFDKAKAEAKEEGYEGIPYNLAMAFVCIEDERFYTHGGVDWKRTIGAFANMFLHFWSSNQGGSTITQQLVKNLTQDKDQNAMRKVREIMRARNIESTVDKDTILECYLNTISFANGIGGVEVASNYYFGKSAHELSLAECAALASIVKEPERYRPDKYPEKNAERRKLVLKKMWEMRKSTNITKEEYEAALAEEVTIVASNESIKKIEINNYFVDALIDDVVHDMVEHYGLDEGYAEKNFYNGGYKIYCTMDPEIQAKIEAIYKDPANFTTSKTGQKGQSAITVMDYTGHVVGIVGGAGEKTANRELNRATSSPRSPGSTMKPIASYSLALDNNLITYSSMFDDQPITLHDGKKWPPNWYGYYGGKVCVAYALERSINTVPAQLVEKLGMENVFDHLVNDMGISTLTKNSNADLTYSALALGSCYHGITTTESCAAYATFGNKGKYYEPTFYTKVTDQKGNVILKGEKKAKIAMAEDTAVIMNHILRNVVDGSQGTGRAARSYMGNMPVYAKTGTTNEDQNCWFAGGTPYYVASCWYGYDQPETVSKSNSATMLWGKVMKEIHKDLEYKEFEESAYVTKRYYCAETGLIATEKCENKGIGWYKKSKLQSCTSHRGEPLPEILPEPAEGEATEGQTSEGEAPVTPQPDVADTAQGGTATAQ